jgi:hypothetical protein
MSTTTAPDLVAAAKSFAPHSTLIFSPHPA